MIQEFLKHIESERRYSALTVRNYRRDLEAFDLWRRAAVTERIEQALQNGKICTDNPDITGTTSEDIRNWIVHRTDIDKISPASMNRELSTLRSFFKFLRHKGKINSDIFTHIGTLKRAKRLPSVVPESRIPQMLESTAEGVETGDFEQVRDALMVLMFYKCGLRLAELIGINTEDLSANYTSLKIRGKGDKERIVPIVDSVRTVLNNYFDAIKGQKICNSREKALFLTTEGCRISRTRAYRTVRAALEGIGMQGKKSPHVLRHTFATQLLNSGADMRDIQELMGHASLSSTQVYTHNSIVQLQAAYAKAHPREDKN